MKRTVYILFLMLFCATAASAQKADSDTTKKITAVQISGLVADIDSSKAIPFVTVRIKNARMGTISDYDGFFTVVAKPGDTLLFSSVGYKSGLYFVPQNPEEDRIYMQKQLKRDTIYLKTKTVMPFSKEGFEKAFMDLKLNDEDYDRAMKNLNEQELALVYENTPISGGVAFKNVMAERNYQAYYAGGIPPANILNPIAWYKFFDALKKGKFKNPDKK
ncbi:MAG: carboxypeptidase-like regulatory domain-containing protein [Bacteroidia bacterium]|nr:carboxypeptidase-like regulatory domain-containing protein [Bacteroidia bacterium]